jgi:Bacteriocin-protection, YdeI or OmpD-Associated
VEDTVTIEIARAGDEPEMRVPADLRKALAAAPLARAGWQDITPLARRDWIFSISTAKQPQTRKRRIEKACDMLGSGKRRLCCFPGVKWMMKENEKSCGMWLPLPKLKNRI